MFFVTNHEAANIGDGPTETMEGLENFFLAWYTVELLLKVITYRMYFVFGEDWRWNWFDTILVASALFQNVLAESTFDPTFIRTLRVLKLGKALRVFRLLRAFTELRLLMNSIVGSVTALFWSIMLMLMVFFIFSVAFVQGATAYITQDPVGVDVIQLERLKLDFGAVQTAMLSMFATISGGESWVRYYDALQLLDPMYGYGWLFFVAFVNIAFLNIITAIFTEQAISMAQPDREDVVYESRKEFLRQTDELSRICQVVDADGTGTISDKEFKRHMRDQSSPLRTYLEAAGPKLTTPSSFSTCAKGAARTPER